MVVILSSFRSRGRRRIPSGYCQVMLYTLPEGLSWHNLQLFVVCRTTHGQIGDGVQRWTPSHPDRWTCLAFRRPRRSVPASRFVTQPLGPTGADPTLQDSPELPPR